MLRVRPGVLLVRASFAPTTVTRARDFLYARLARVHPQLAGVRVEYAWGGNVGLTLDRVPRLGRVADGVTYALGYSGTGVAASSLFGTAAARWIHIFIGLTRREFVPFRFGYLLMDGDWPLPCRAVIAAGEIVELLFIAKEE